MTATEERALQINRRKTYEELRDAQCQPEDAADREYSALLGRLKVGPANPTDAEGFVHRLDEVVGERLAFAYDRGARDLVSQLLGFPAWEVDARLGDIEERLDAVIALLGQAPTEVSA